MSNSSHPDRPLVSVLIGTYNAEHFIAETLESVLGQTYPNVEIVVVDDGSRDNTWAVLESFGTRIRALRQPNGGIAAARNAGLRAARGHLIALMDHDDLCEPDRVATQVEILRRHPEVVLCSSEFSAFDANGPIAPAYSGTYYVRCSPDAGGIDARFPTSETIDLTAATGAVRCGASTTRVCLGSVYEELALGNFIHPPTVMFRREVLAQVPDFDVQAGLMCDWDWLVRAARTGPFAFVHRSLLRYRRSETQVSSPRFHARSANDAMRISQRIQRDDPGLFRRRRDQFRASLGQMCLNASEVNVATDRRLATSLLLRSVLRYRMADRHVVRATIRLLTPNSVWNAARRLRSRLMALRHASIAGQAMWIDWDELALFGQVLSFAA